MRETRDLMVCEHFYKIPFAICFCMLWFVLLLLVLLLMRACVSAWACVYVSMMWVCFIISTFFFGIDFRMSLLESRQHELNELEFEYFCFDFDCIFYLNNACVWRWIFGSPTWIYRIRSSKTHPEHQCLLSIPLFVIFVNVSIHKIIEIRTKPHAKRARRAKK